MGKEKGTDNKNSKSLRVKGFAIFVVCSLLLAHLGPPRRLKTTKITNP